MPAFGNIAIADAETSPVTHTFAPVTTNGARADLANRSATIPTGYEKLQIELVQPKSASAAYRLAIGFNDPVEATVDGQVVVVRNNSASLQINLSQLSTAQERKNTLKLMANLLAHATIVSVVENLEPIY